MKVVLLIGLIIGLLLSLPVSACTATDITNSIKALNTKITSMDTDQKVDINVLTKLHTEIQKILSSCQYNAINSNELTEIKSKLVSDDNNLEELREKLETKSDQSIKLSDTNRLILVQQILESQQTIDTNIELIDPLLDENINVCLYKKDKGYIWSLISNLEQDTQDTLLDKQGKLKEYIDSCIANITNMNQVKITEVDNEMKKALDWVSQIHTLTFFKAVDAAPKAAFYENTKTQLERGVNVFAKPTNGWTDAFESYFYAGYEGTTVDKVKNKGSTRLGLYIYNQFESLIDKCPPAAPKNCGLQFIFPHVYGNIFQSSSAESSSTAGNTAGGGTAIQADVSTSMETNIGIFWPLHTHRQQEYNNREGILATGIILEHGRVMNSNIQNSIQRRYQGVRAAFSQDSYADLLIGETSGRLGRRIELRGQMPIYDFAIGQIFLGGVLNYDVDNAEANTDSVRLYAIYRASFDDIFGKQN